MVCTVQDGVPSQDQLPRNQPTQGQLPWNQPTWGRLPLDQLPTSWNSTVECTQCWNSALSSWLTVKILCGPWPFGIISLFPLPWFWIVTFQFLVLVTSGCLCLLGFGATFLLNVCSDFWYHKGFYDDSHNNHLEGWHNRLVRIKWKFNI